MFKVEEKEVFVCIAIVIFLKRSTRPRGSMAEHVTRNDEIGGSTPPAG